MNQPKAKKLPVPHSESPPSSVRPKQPPPGNDGPPPWWKRAKVWQWIGGVVGAAVLLLVLFQSVALIWEVLQDLPGAYIEAATRVLYRSEGVKMLVAGLCLVLMPILVIWTIVRYSGSEHSSNGL